MTLHPDPGSLRIDEEGVIRVGQSRVTLDVVVDDYQSGLSPEEIARQLDTLSLADVYGALAYYFRHKEELDEYLRQREEMAEKLRQEIESKQQPLLAQMKARMDAFRAQKDAADASPAQ